MSAFLCWGVVGCSVDLAMAPQSGCASSGDSCYGCQAAQVAFAREVQITGSRRADVASERHGSAASVVQVVLWPCKWFCGSCTMQLIPGFKQMAQYGTLSKLISAQILHFLRTALPVGPVSSIAFGPPCIADRSHWCVSSAGPSEEALARRCPHFGFGHASACKSEAHWAQASASRDRRQWSWCGECSRREEPLTSDDFGCSLCLKLPALA